jgi:hypothetical protein
MPGFPRSGASASTGELRASGICRNVRWKELEVDFHLSGVREQSCHMPPTDIPAKLRATMAALGCHTRKELVARFRTSNPRSACDIEPLHKWMQGRATPRLAGFYDEWAALIGLARPGAWIATCTLETFLAETTACSGFDDSTLRRSAAPKPARLGPAAQTHGLLGGLASLCGTYLCWSRATSPHYPNHIIRGLLQLAPDRDASLRANYSEHLPSGEIVMEGRAAISGRTLNIEMGHPDSGLTMVIVAHVPGPPVSVLCGLSVGASALASEALPSAEAILAVRATMAGSANVPNGYMRICQSALSADLAAIGIMGPASDAVAARAVSFLSPPPLQVPRAVQSGFASDLGS